MERNIEESGNGARGRDRTTDTAIFSRMLYQLSYPGLLYWPSPETQKPVPTFWGTWLEPGQTLTAEVRGL